MSVLGATFLGVGAMVGAGIFALLGQAASFAGAAVWISFLVAATIALLQGYSFAKLGVRYPSGGGTIEFLVRGFGTGHVTGVSAWIMYFSGIIVTAMVSVSFGSYLGALLFDDPSPFTVSLLASVLIVAVGVTNLAGAEAVNRAQTVIVAVLLVILSGFAAITMVTIDPSLLSPSGYPPAGDVVGSVALTFFAYLGFSVVAFSAGDIPNPERNLPKAMYLSIGIATVVYVAIALGVLGTLTVDEVVAHGDTALAVAAEPSLGQAGFTIMALAALLATASSANANTYAAGGVTSLLGRMRLFPPAFGRVRSGGGSHGIVLSVLFVLVVVWLFDLTAIASMGSAVALIVFTMVSITHIRLRHETGARLWLLGLGLLATLAALAAFVSTTLIDEPKTASALGLTILLATALDFGWTTVRDRRSRTQPAPPGLPDADGVVPTSDGRHRRRP